MQYIYAANKEETNLDRHTIIAGDFNQVQDGMLDKTSPTTNVPKDRKSIHLLMKDLGLV